MARILAFTFGIVLLHSPSNHLLATAAALKQQPLEPLIKFRVIVYIHGERTFSSVAWRGQTHRKTSDGRLCAGAYVHNSQAYTAS